MDEDLPDLVNGTYGDVSLDYLCCQCVHMCMKQEGESCALYSFGEDPITFRRYNSLVFCNWARTGEGPCGRVAFGYQQSELYP